LSLLHLAQDLSSPIPEGGYFMHLTQ
jgi:hypothetical protein